MEVGIETTYAFRSKAEVNGGEETEAVADHLQVPKEETSVETIGAQEDLHLADNRMAKVVPTEVGRCLRRMTRTAFPALRKGRTHTRPSRNNFANGTLQGRMLGNRPECNNGIRIRDL
jgi:hypothetical protein